MSNISDVFTRYHKALIPYITVGYPDINSTVETARLLVDCGCDIIELGIPFSDPLADGVTIQNSSYHALLNGVTTGTCLEIAAKIREIVQVPLVFMTYYNPVFKYGLRSFCCDCAAAGVDGLIIPDLPPEEGAELESLSLSHQIDLIYLVAPTSDNERIRLVAEHSRGFIYMVSVAGITGTRGSLAVDLPLFVNKVRQYTAAPICVGFGISTGEQAATVAKIADGVIVGSRIIQLMESNDKDVLSTFVRGLRSSIDSVVR
jgi:tryptophan synthase alpha chain